MLTTKPVVMWPVFYESLIGQVLAIVPKIRSILTAGHESEDISTLLKELLDGVELPDEYLRDKRLKQELI